MYFNDMNIDFGSFLSHKTLHGNTFPAPPGIQDVLRERQF